MPFNVRRIVTGHAGGGNAVVSSIDILHSRAGNLDKALSNALVWATDTAPPETTGDDPLLRKHGQAPVNGGTMFRLLELPPGNEPKMHKTETLDYVIVLDGEVDMVLDAGAEVHMSAGDVMVQRATWHGWVNRGTKPCRIAFVLVDASPR